MLAGELYSPVDPELEKSFKTAKQLLLQLNTEGFADIERNREILSKLLPHSSRKITIQPPFYCDYGSNIYCEDDVYFNANCVVLDVTPVRIGARTLIGPNVQIYTATHPTDYRIRQQGLEYGSPITIGEDCWIGGNTVLCPGVTLGNRCIVAAGAVVTCNVPDDTMVGGVPAHIIKQLTPP